MVKGKIEKTYDTNNQESSWYFETNLVKVYWLRLLLCYHEKNYP